jgi:hypothetical protein
VAAGGSLWQRWVTRWFDTHLVDSVDLDTLKIF